MEEITTPSLSQTNLAGWGPLMTHWRLICQTNLNLNTLLKHSVSCSTYSKFLVSIITFEIHESMPYYRGNKTQYCVNLTSQLSLVWIRNIVLLLLLVYFFPLWMFQGYTIYCSRNIVTVYILYQNTYIIISMNLISSERKYTQ